MESHAFVPKLILLRYSKSTSGVFGTYFDFDGKPFAVSLENPDTLIPADLYEAVPTVYHEGGYKTFEILVPGRTEIKIHKLNKFFESKGCLGIAEKFVEFGSEAGKLQGPGVAESDEGFKEFMKKYGSFPKIYVDIQEHFVEDTHGAATVS